MLSGRGVESTSPSFGFFFILIKNIHEIFMYWYQSPRARIAVTKAIHAPGFQVQIVALTFAYLPYLPSLQSGI